MKDKSTTCGLNPEKIVKLLNIAKDITSVPADTNQYKSDLISQKLRETVPIYFSTEQNPEKKLQRLRHTIAALSGEPVGKLLENPKTDIKLIRMIKDYGRKLSAYAESEAEHHVSNTIYYAAIAHALVHHNIKITNYSFENLIDFFNQLSKENWIPEILSNLFKKANKYCNMKMN
jgi:hypothetical protein